MPLIDLHNVTMANTTLQMLWAVNDLSGRWFGIMFIVCVLVIIFINLSFYADPKNVVLYAGFFMWAITGIAWLAGIIPMYIFIIFLCLGAMAVLQSFLVS